MKKKMEKKKKDEKRARQMVGDIEVLCGGKDSEKMDDELCPATSMWCTEWSVVDYPVVP